jgi:hypothetical protein
MSSSNREHLVYGDFGILVSEEIWIIEELADHLSNDSRVLMMKTRAPGLREGYLPLNGGKVPTTAMWLK